MLALESESNFIEKRVFFIQQHSHSVTDRLRACWQAVGELTRRWAAGQALVTEEGAGWGMASPPFKRLKSRG